MANGLSSRGSIGVGPFNSTSAAIYRGGTMPSEQARRSAEAAKPMVEFVTNLWREHAATQTEKGEATTPESFVDFLLMDGWLDPAVVEED